MITRIVTNGDASEQRIAELGRRYGLAATRYDCRQPGRPGRRPYLCISVDCDNSSGPFMKNGEFDVDEWERHQLHFYARSSPRGKGDLNRLLRDIRRRFVVRTGP